LPHPKFWAGYISAAANVYATVSIFGVKTNAPRRLKWCQTGFIQKNVKLFQNVSICFFPQNPKEQQCKVQVFRWPAVFYFLHNAFMFYLTQANRLNILWCNYGTTFFAEYLQLALRIFECSTLQLFCPLCAKR